MTAVQWQSLRTGDAIVCPSDGIEEKITHNRPYVRGMRAVRTHRHDHFKKSTDCVERTYRKEQR